MVEVFHSISFLGMSKSQVVFGKSFETASYKIVQLEPDIVKAIQTGGR